MTDGKPTRPTLGFAEREALHTLKKAIERKPELAAQVFEMLVKDKSKRILADMLLAAKNELDQLLEVNRALMAATQHAMKHLPTEEGDKQ